MSDRDLSVDSILKEIAANRGVPYEKRRSDSRISKDVLVDEIIAESAFKTSHKEVFSPAAKPAVTPPAAAEKKPERTDAGKSEKKAKKKEQDDPLASITPWKERHGADKGMTASEAEQIGRRQGAVGEMKGVKNAESFFHSLKKTAQPKEEKAQLLYKNAGSVHPPAEPTRVSEAGPLEEVTSDRLKKTVEDAARQMEQTYEPTRVIRRQEKKSTPLSAQEQTIHFDAPVRLRADELTGQVRLDGFDDPPQAPESEEWQEEFVSSRQDKVRQFKMTKPESDEPELPLTAEEDGEYHTLRDAAPLKYDLLARRRSTSVRMGLTALFLLLTLLLSLVDTVDITNGLLSDNPLVRFCLYGAVLLLAVAVNFRVLWGGLTALFTGADQDTPAALAMTAALVQGVLAVTLQPNLTGNTGGMLIGCPALLCLLLNLWGKRTMFTRLYRNLELIGNEREKYAVTMVENREEAFELGRGLAVGSPRVAFAKPGVNLQHAIYHSYAPDRAELSARLPTLLAPLFGLLSGLMAFFFTTHEGSAQTVMQVVSAVGIGLCVFLPATVLLAGNVPLNRFGRSLYRRRIMLSGYDAVEQMKDTDVLTLDASQLFPAGSITLKSIKSASNQSLDRSIMDVAGVVYMADCPLKPLFETIIQGKTKLLPEVDTLVYEEEMGISGWVMGYRVLVGTRKLMENHGIIIPDTDYEEKYNEPGLKAVYLSTQGILSAVFLVKYTPDPDVMQALQQAVAAGLSLHIYSCDPNITRELVCRMFRLPSASVRIMGAVPRRLYKQQMDSTQAPEAVLSYEGNAAGFCRGVAAAMKLHRVIRFAAVLQTVFVLLGAVLCCVGLYVLGTAGLSGGFVLLYQLVTALLTVGLPALCGR